MTETRRVETIQIKLTPAEKQYLRKSAGSQSLSAYVRGQLLLNQREAKTETTPNKGTSPPKKSITKSSDSPSRAKPNFRPT